VMKKVLQFFIDNGYLTAHGPESRMHLDVRGERVKCGSLCNLSF